MRKRRKEKEKNIKDARVELHKAGSASGS